MDADDFFVKLRVKPKYMDFLKHLKQYSASHQDKLIYSFIDNNGGKDLSNNVKIDVHELIRLDLRKL